MNSPMPAFTELFRRKESSGGAHTQFREELTPTKRSDEKLMTRAGYGGKEIAGKFWFLPYGGDHTGETETMRAAYKAMMKSPYIKSPMLMLVYSVASLDWQIIPEKQNSPRDTECGEFLRHCFESLPDGMPGLSVSCLLPQSIDGYSIAEKVLTIERAAPRWRGKAVLKAVKPKDTDLYNLQVDEFNNVLGVQGKGVNPSDHYYPINEFIYSRNLPIYDEPKGMSSLRAAYSAYWMLDTVTKLRAIHNEKYTTPFLMGTYQGDNQDQKNSLESALSAAKANTWISIPEGAKVEAVNMAGQGESDYKSFCDDCKRDMLIAIIGAYLQVLEGQVADGRGNADVSSKDVTSLFQWMLAARFQEIVNKQIIPELVALNYAGVGGFRLVLGGVSEDEVAKTVQNLQGLQAMGYPISASEVARRTSYGMGKGDDVLKPPQQAAQPSPFGGAAPFSERTEPAELANIEPAKPAPVVETFVEEQPRSPTARRARRRAYGVPVRHVRPIDVAAQLSEIDRRLEAMKNAADPRIDRLSEQVADLATKRTRTVKKEVVRDPDTKSIVGSVETEVVE